jgi:hypothetical protein
MNPEPPLGREGASRRKARGLEPPTSCHSQRFIDFDADDLAQNANPGRIETCSTPSKPKKRGGSNCRQKFNILNAYGVGFQPPASRPANRESSPADKQKSNHLAQNGLAFPGKPSIAVRTGSR